MNDEVVKTIEEILYFLVVFLWGLLSMFVFLTNLYLLITYIIITSFIFVFYLVMKIKIWKIKKKRIEILDGKRGPDYGKID